MAGPWTGQSQRVRQSERDPLDRPRL